MRKSFIALLLFAGAILPAVAQTAPAKPDAMAIAQALSAKVADAIEKQDAAAWAGTAVPDVTILPVASPLAPSGIVHGRAAAEKMFAGMFKMGVKHVDIKILEAHFLSPSSLWWAGTIHFSGGMDIYARIGIVAVKSKGTWGSRLVVLSPNPAPTA